MTDGSQASAVQRGVEAFLQSTDVRRREGTCIDDHYGTAVVYVTCCHGMRWVEGADFKDGSCIRCVAVHHAQLGSLRISVPPVELIRQCIEHPRPCVIAPP